MLVDSAAVRTPRGLSTPSLESERPRDLSGHKARVAGDMWPAIPECDVTQCEKDIVIPYEVSVGGAAGVGKFAVEFRARSEIGVPTIRANPTPADAFAALPD